MTLEDAQKLVAILSDNSGNFCTCWVCEKAYAQDLQRTFPELRWGYEEKDDQSGEAILMVRLPEPGDTHVSV